MNNHRPHARPQGAHQLMDCTILLKDMQFGKVTLDDWMGKANSEGQEPGISEGHMRSEATSW